MKSLLKLCLFAMLHTACGPVDPKVESEEEIDVVRSTAAVTSRIGPAGGELRAPQGHVLEGVVVKIPAGALATETDFTLEGTIDETPLSQLSERVGPQLRITPDAVTLTKGATLTVPIDLMLLSAFGKEPSSCAVWQREGAGWTKLTQTASTATSVTVESTSLATVAAGIALNPRAFCAANPVQCLGANLSIGVCAAPAGSFCVKKLPDLTKGILDGTSSTVAIVGGKLHYAHAPSSGRLAIAKYDLASGQTTVLESLAAAGGFLTARGEIAVEADGTTWLSTARGNIAFKPAAAPQGFDNANGFGVAVIDGVTTRFFTKLVTVTKGQPAQLRLCATPGGCAPMSGLNSLVQVKGRPGAVAVDAQAPKFAALAGNGVAVFSNLSSATTFAPSLYSGGLLSQTAFATSTKSKAFGLSQITNLEGSFNSTRVNDVGSPSQSGAFATHLAFLDDDRLAGIDGEDAMVSVLGADGVTKNISLSSAAPGTPDYNRMLPRAIANIPGTNRFIIVTRGLSGGPAEVYELRPVGN